LRGVGRQVNRDALGPGLGPLLNPISDRLADQVSQLPCAIADLVFLPPVSNCSEPAPERGNPSLGGAGQCPAFYSISATAIRKSGGAPTRYSDVFRGPISFIGMRLNEYGVLMATINSASGQRDIITLGGSINDWNFTYAISRQDGQPDNCGNTSGYPGGLTGNDIQNIQRTIRDALNGIPGANDSDPCACFAPEADFWKNLRKALESLLAGGSGIPGDRDGDGIPDEQDEDEEEEDPNKDQKCKGMSELAQLYAMVRRLDAFLGGGEFGNDRCDPKNTIYKVNPEALIRQFTEAVYDFQTGDGRITAINSSEIEVKSLPQLLAALLSVGYTRSGQWRYPSRVDDSIVKSDSGFLGDLFGKPQRTLSDQQDYHQWNLEQFDAVLGPWQQKIEIVDSDLEQPGNQSKTVRLPNLAEAISEIFILAFDAKTTNDTTLNFLTRLALEQAAIKKEVVVTQKWAEVIADYLGPKTKEVQADLPLLFTLLTADGQQPSEANLKSRNSISTLLEVSTKKIVIPELAQSQNLQADLQTFRQGVAIVRAALSQSFGKKSAAAIRDAIVSSIVNAAKFVDLGGDETDEEPAGGDFSTFLTEAEQGFIGTPGITDTTNPFGRPQDQRPRIREIGRDGDNS
jgi:hypothetical protein